MKCFISYLFMFLFFSFFTVGLADEQVDLQRVGNCTYFQADPPGMEYACPSGATLSKATIQNDTSVSDLNCTYSESLLSCKGIYLKGMSGEQGNYNLQFVCSAGKGWSGVSDEESDGPWTCGE